MKKRILSGALAIIITVIIAAPVVPAFAVTTGDPLQDNQKIVDIYINADVDSGIDPDVIKDMLREKLEGATKYYDGTPGILADSDIRINTNMVSLDISDLSAWYVYDHYGSNTGAVYANDNQTGKMTPPTSWTDVYGPSTLKRPYFAYYEGNDYMNPGVYKISDYLQLSTDQQRSVAALDQHIYALQDSGGDYAMTFVGYGSPAYGDFLYYPATSSGTKQVTFTVDSNYVNTHTMDPTYGGAGFLLNTGIDSDGYIHGYVLLYQFESESSLSGIALYKINDNVLADDFHQSGIFNGGWNEYTSLPTFVTQVASVTGVDWNSMMDIRLEIKPNNIMVEQKATGADTYVEVMNEAMNETAYNGFGPLVQYSSHGCSDATQFRFTKLKMGFAASSSSVMDALAKANFLSNSEKYFVNLLSTDGSSTLNDGDWEGIARMRTGEVRYVTNVENPFLNDGGIVTSGAPNGSNGKTIKTYADLDELTDKLVAYILGNNTYKAPSGSIALSSPVAIFDLRAEENESVATVVRDFIGTDGLDVYTSDDSIPSDGATITTYKYKITTPSGSAQTLADRTSPASASNPLMTVETDTELGVWTVDLTVVDSNSKTSSTSTTTFNVVEAQYFDTEILPGAHMTFVDELQQGTDPDQGNTVPSVSQMPSLGNTQTVLQYNEMEDIYVQADAGYAVPGTYYIGKGIYFVKLADDQGVVTGIPTGDLSATLKDCRIASVVTFALGTGDGNTPDKDKYYATISPTDPMYEYNVVDEDGNPYPEGQAWVPGGDQPLVFGPYDEPGTYYIAIRLLETSEISDVIDTFEIQGVDNPAEPGTDAEADTGDTTNNIWLALAAMFSMAGMGAVLYRRRRIEE
jgi:LPXTG-motif cell wall-anchored protein